MQGRLVVLGFVVSCGFAAPRERAAPQALATAEAAPSFRHGVTVNHWVGGMYEPYHTYAAPWFDREDVAWIADHGFDHVRMRVDMTDWVGPDGALDPAKLAPIDALVAWTRDERLGLVLAASRFRRPVARAARLDYAEPALRVTAATTWAAVARRYAERGDELRFELHQQPSPIDPAGVAGFYEHLVAAVRAVDPRRYLYVSPPDMTFASVDRLVVPAGPRIGVALELFELAPLVGSLAVERGDEPTQAELDAAFARASALLAARAPGRELYLAQWGVCFQKGTAALRAQVGWVRAALERHGIGWAVYDYESGCAMREPDGTPSDGYAALELGAAARELRYARIDREGRRLDDALVLRISGLDMGLHSPAGAGRRRSSALLFDADGQLARYDSRSYEGDTDRFDYTVDATWRRAGEAELPLPRHAEPLLPALLARWLVAHPGRASAQAPASRATAEVVGTLRLDGEAITQVEILGLDRSPVAVWLAADGTPVAVIDEGGTYVVESHLAAAPAILASQRRTRPAPAQDADAGAGARVHR